jgi:hypothetical protein
LRRSKDEAERNADMRAFLEAASLLRISQKVEKPLVAVRDTNDPQLSFFEAQRIAEHAQLGCVFLDLR